MGQNAQAMYAGLLDGRYHRLGKKTFILFVIARLHAPIILLFATIAAFAVQGDPVVAKILGPKIAPYAAVVPWWLFIAFLVVFALSYFIAWLIYVNYKFSLGEDALKIERGIFDKEEVAIPYRQIQDVDVERSLYFRMMGLSKLVILTAGRDDDQPKATAAENESEGILPAMDRDLASWLQDVLLKRTDVQRVVEVDEPHQQRPAPPTGPAEPPAEPPAASN